MIRIRLIYIMLITACSLEAQIPVGSWRQHLPCNNASHLAYTGNMIYCTTGESLYSYNFKDNSVEKKSKINGLSDFGISAIAFSQEKNVLIIGYQNGNIDIISGNSTYNISELKDKSIPASKSINHILFDGKWAYLSCGFGVLLLDIEKNEIKDTYIFGPQGTYIQVNSCTLLNDSLYAATASGIYKANKNDPFLVDFSKWVKVTGIPHADKAFIQVTTHNDILYAIYANPAAGQDTLYYCENNIWKPISLDENTNIWNVSFSGDNIYLSCDINLKVLDKNHKLVTTLWQYEGIGNAQPRETCTDASGDLWIADNGNGMIRQKGNGAFGQVMPNGPLTSRVRSFLYSNGSLYVTAGGTDISWGNLYSRGEYYVFSDEEWKNVINEGVFDYLVAKADPADPDLIYVGTWGAGVFVYKNGEVQHHYDETNSTLQNAIAGGLFTRIGGMDFDKDGNLWVANSSVNNSLSVMKKSGGWTGFALRNRLGADYVGDIVVDDNNHVWAMLGKGQGIAVLNFNNTPDNQDDDVLVKFKPRNIFGQTVGNVYCINKDLDGNIWVGTDYGPVVYSNPGEVFNGSTDGVQPTIPRHDGKGTVDPLLGNESIHSIAIDGANRKWLGTERGGAFLATAAGDSTIYQFNTDNSPLLSNYVLGIGIQDKTGEVFFGTDRGIVSFRSTATKGGEDFGDVYAFPNPVRPDYHGLITITGLIKNANVKITDIAGNLVYETTTLGGQVVWDGNNFDGRRVATGVYLIFCSNEDGSKTHITKLLMIK